MGISMKDLTFSLRNLRRSPGFTSTAVGALGIGIAANTAILTVVNAVILRPLPFADSDRFVSIGLGGSGSSAYVPMFFFWERHNPGLEDVAAWMPGSNLNLNGGDNDEVVAAMRASRNYFPLFGARPNALRANGSKKCHLHPCSANTDMSTPSAARVPIRPGSLVSCI
jgi:hypothetical protein